MYIYIEKINEQFNNEFLPTFKKEELKTIDCERVKTQSVAGYSLLYKIAKEKFNITLKPQEMKRENNSKPKCDFFNFSISHSKDLVAVALSKKEIGIDIEFEKKDRNFDLIKEKNFNLEEKPQNFYKVWTKKEAIFKSLDKTSFDLIKINTVNYDCLTCKISNGVDNYYFSVYSKNLKDLKELIINKDYNINMEK
jgi:4'-phosphopantetheinyl transferase